MKVQKVIRRVAIFIFMSFVLACNSDSNVVLVDENGLYDCRFDVRYNGEVCGCNNGHVSIPNSLMPNHAEFNKSLNGYTYVLLSQNSLKKESFYHNNDTLKIFKGNIDELELLRNVINKKVDSILTLREPLDSMDSRLLIDSFNRSLKKLDSIQNSTPKRNERIVDDVEL